MSATTRTTSCGHIDCLGLASCGQAGLLREDRYMAGYRDGKDYWRPIVAEAIKDLREGADEVVLDGLLAAYARAYPERDALAVAQVPAQEERPELLKATDPRQVSSSAQEEGLDVADLTHLNLAIDEWWMSRKPGEVGTDGTLAALRRIAAHVARALGVEA